MSVSSKRVADTVHEAAEPSRNFVVFAGYHQLLITTIWHHKPSGLMVKGTPLVAEVSTACVAVVKDSKARLRAHLLSTPRS